MFLFKIHMNAGYIASWIIEKYNPKRSANVEVKALRISKRMVPIESMVRLLVIMSLL